MNTSLRYLRRGSAEDTSSAWNLDRATGLRNIEHNRPQQQTRKKTTQNAIQLSQTGPLPYMLQLHFSIPKLQIPDRTYTKPRHL